MKILKKKDEDKFSLIKILSVVGLVLAIIVSGFTIYDRFSEPKDEGLTIEQTVSPDALKALKDGDKTIRIEKGITIKRSGE